MEERKADLRRQSDDPRYVPPWLDVLTVRVDAQGEAQSNHEVICLERHAENGRKHDQVLQMISDLRSVQNKTVLFLLSFAGSVIVLLLKMLLR